MTAFINVQIGGSVFRHGETRSKNFRADPDAEPLLSEAINQREAHRRMFTAVFAWLESCRDETELWDTEAVEDDVDEDLQEEIREEGGKNDQREHDPRGRTDRDRRAVRESGA